MNGFDDPAVLGSDAVRANITKPSFARSRPSQAEAEAAVRTLISWAGDDPARPGLLDTPSRVARAYEEWFRGYKEDPVELLERTFDEIGSYSEAVELHGIRFHSFCEHHMAGIEGTAHIAYLPVGRVVGISKLARAVESCARRLQIQERLTDEIATAIDAALKPRGVAVVIEAEHGCMTSRGIRAHGARLVTRRMLGAYGEDETLRGEFLAAAGF
ncbi:GTP cyclohydrolase I FolE [Nitratireductor mangrovi]|uniref:GTP cyclohydrolase 1 n=1 Tax=Nitratireductor mangrovi TaxID=2599600 RepID=A0A5B8KVC4_9HYPH|nr:GTP cyclohydrolase I FolE [Nitratireductor mangrovi]QDY99593.1 GTP cyclohydrolase I FolE [Nitratireductor mangrovi]